ncbi:MAG TPA: hypothetical protein VE172_20790, partial [Stackebrandtia sp.]|uniref:hypothetical protein n=1 Tax=Stackebrandtia sp. TaxID=2023065 RepID=UPI002D690FFE
PSPRQRLGLPQRRPRFALSRGWTQRPWDSPEHAGGDIRVRKAEVHHAGHNRAVTSARDKSRSLPSHALADTSVAEVRSPKQYPAGVGVLSRHAAATPNPADIGKRATRRATANARTSVTPSPRPARSGGGPAPYAARRSDAARLAAAQHRLRGQPPRRVRRRIYPDDTVEER